MLRQIVTASLWAGLTCAIAANAGAQTSALKASRLSGGTKLDFRGEAGAEYHLDATSNLGNPFGWKFLGSVTLGADGAQSWDDTNSTGLRYRFYRARKFDALTDRQRANDFRLIDHAGRSRELFYRSADKAVVLVFINKDCSESAAALTSVKALSTQFSQRGVSFWGIAPDSTATRDSLAALATGMSLGFPLLHDAEQLAAQEFSISSSGEVIAIDPNSWEVFYRGAIESQPGATGSTPLLATALNQFLQGSAISPSRTPVSGCDLNMPAPSTPSYARDVAPILLQRCVQCHSPGNIGSWAMTNYDAVKIYASSMQRQVLAGEMPPWHADPAYGKFANDISLSSAQKRSLIDWIRAGAPRGDGTDPLAQNALPPAVPWPLGQPDAIVRIPAQSIKAFGVEAYRYIKVATPFTSDVWLRAAVVRPGNTRVVHHALVLNGTSLAGLDGYFAGFVPGIAPVFFPPDTAKLLPKGTQLQFQMHYTTTGTPETDETELGLYVQSSAPKYTLQTKASFSVLFSIPPGNPDYEVTASTIFSRRSMLYEMSPHMHLRGSRFKYELRYPNGTSETILSVPHYEFNWQTLYRFATPKEIPAGTTLVCTGAFDNSAQNPENPDPTKRVGFGEQTFDEMFIGYFNFVEL